MELNKQYDIILNENSFERFDAKYLDIDWDRVIQDHKDSGGDAADLLEPIDGFHPSQLMNELLSDIVWDFLEVEFPEALGPINPFNDEIKMRFRDQGGF